MTLPESTAYAADLTWVGGRFAPGVAVEVGADGRIAAVHSAVPPAGPQGGGAPAPRRLPRRALLPGFVDAHSHAFQRGLRGLGETFPAGAGSFWTWREAMYDLVATLDRSRFGALCLQAFAEMRAAGITAVGEFHYVRHLHPEAADFVFDDELRAAARAVGLRLVLLPSFYAHGGIGRPLAGAQRRFGTPSPAAYWERIDALAARLDPARESLGVVAHSLRAATLEETAALYAEARRRGLPFHMHVEEQRQEIEEVEAAYGRSPMELLNDELAAGPGFTAVHCTHTRRGELERFVAAGGAVCVCPLTEANLGDGLPPLAGSQEVFDRLCLGTDSNARISMLEEMRWLEYGQRLATERRGVLRDGETGRVAPRLLSAATAGGARALGLASGEIATGRWADFALVDLDHPSLEGCGEPERLAEALVFGGGDGTIAATAVGGRWDREP